eukprot:GHVT01088276.1.p1 GENE.GHVT01088276.1~~GHVT01088276.1.p1  ORF type:complete len:646 (-),score=223.14 GHVT01088276.1:504-2342(-)
MARIDQQVRKREQKQRALQAALGETTANLGSATAAVERLMEDKGTLEANERSLQAKVAALEERLAASESARQQAEAAPRPTLATQQLHQRVREVEESARAVQAALKAKELDYAGACERLEAFRLEACAWRSKAQEWKEKLASTRAALEDSQAAEGRQRRKCLEIEEEFSKAKFRQGCTEEELLKLRSAQAASSATVTALEGRLKEEQEGSRAVHREAAESMRRTREDAAEALSIERKSQAAKVSELECEFKRALSAEQQRAKELDAALRAAHPRMEEQTGLLKQAAEQEVAAHRTIEKLAGRLDRSAKDLAAAQEEKVKAQEELAKLKTAERKMRLDYDAANHSLQQAHLQLQQLHQKFATRQDLDAAVAKQEEAEAKAERLAVWKAEKEETMEAQHKELLELRVKVRQQQASQCDRDVALAVKTRLVEDLGAQLQRVKVQSEQREGEWAARTEKWQGRHRQAVEGRKKDLANLNRARDFLEKELDDLRAALAEKEEGLATADARLTAMQNEMQKQTEEVRAEAEAKTSSVREQSEALVSAANENMKELAEKLQAKFESERRLRRSLAATQKLLDERDDELRVLLQEAEREQVAHRHRLRKVADLVKTIEDE